VEPTNPLHDAGVEVAADESEHSLVRDSLCELAHQHVVVHAVEKLFEVHVDHPAATFLDVLLRLAHCVVCTTSRPEAVAVG
jgi:hypothetical protein